MANNFGKGIKVTSGFDLSAKGPLDNRTVVDTIAQRDTHVTAGRAYAGLKVYVTSQNKEYIYTGTSWIESGGLTDDQLGQLTVAYAHSMTEHVSKETFDTNFENINNQISNMVSNDELSNLLNNKSDISHGHNDVYYTKEQTDQKIIDIVADGKVDLSNYATKLDLEAKANWGHSHTLSDVEQLEAVLNEKADKKDTATVSMLAGKSDAGHTHSISDIGDLQDALDLKANMSSVYNKLDINTKFAEVNVTLNSKADSSHNHNDVYYTQKQVDEAIAKAITEGEVDLSNYATLADLNNKANIDNNHDVLNALERHNHNDLYYAKGSLDEVIKNKADAGHNHDDIYYTQNQVDQKLTDEIKDLSEDMYKKSEVDSLITNAKTEAIAHADTELLKITSEVSDDYNTLKKIELAIIENNTTLDNKIKAVENNLLTKADSVHNHDDRYYDKTTVENMIKTGIEGAELSQYATKEDLNRGLLEKADWGHSHTISDVEDLSGLLDSKISKEEAATKQELQNGLSNKSDLSHDHDGIYALESHVHTTDNVTDLFDKVYSKEEVRNMVSDKADAGHNHDDVYAPIVHEHDNYCTKEDFNEYKNDTDALLNKKGDIGHGHTIEEITDLKTTLEAKIEKDYVDDSINQLEEDMDQRLLNKETELRADFAKEINALVDSAPEAMDTLNELASAIQEHQTVYEAYVQTVSSKLSEKSDIGHGHGISEVAGLKEALDDKANADDIANANAELKTYIDQRDQNMLAEAQNHANGLISEIKDNVSTDMDTLNKIATEINLYKTNTNKQLQDLTNTVSNKANSDHNHDEVYAALEHVHDIEDINELTNQFYNKTEISNLLANYSELDHGHTYDEIGGLQGQLDLKANKEEIQQLNSSLKEYIDERDQDVFSNALIHVDEQISDLKGEPSEEMDTLEKIEDAVNNHISEFEQHSKTMSELINGKASSDHIHDDRYAALEHNHDLEDLNGLEVRLGEVISTATTDAVTQANTYTEERLAEIIGDSEDGNTLSGLLNKIDNHIADFDTYKDSVNNALSNKSNTDHKHDDKYAALNHTHDLEDMPDLSESYYDKNEIDELVNGKADSVHSHDEVYSKLNHTHVANNITDLYDNIYKKLEVDSLLNGKADNTHGHVISEVEGLNEILASKASTTYVDNKVDEHINAVNNALANKSDSDHNHNNVYANFNHNHEMTDINGLVNKLDEVKNEAINQSNSDSKDYIDGKIQEIIGGDGNGLSLNGIASNLAGHVEEFVAYKAITDTALNNKADRIHDHEISEVVGLQTELNKKANAADVNLITANITEAINDAKAEAEENSKKYTDNAITNLVDSAPDAMNTLNELATAINNNKEIYDAYVESMTAALAGKADLVHSHDQYVTKEELDEEIGDIDFSAYALKTDLNNYSRIDHNHDDKYAQKTHTHDITEIGNLSNSYYDKTQIDGLLAGKSDSNHKHDDIYSKLSHQHSCSEITDITSKYYGKTDIDTLLAGKADVSHNHDTRYYLKYQVDAKINSLGIAGYAKLEDLINWASQFALKNHTHEDLSSTALITNSALSNVIFDVYGIVL